VPEIEGSLEASSEESSVMAVIASATSAAGSAMKRYEVGRWGCDAYVG